MNERDLARHTRSIKAASKAAENPADVIAAEFIARDDKPAGPSAVTLRAQRRAQARRAAANAFDHFCELTLQSDLTDDELTAYAKLVIADYAEAGTPEEMIARLDAMTPREFARCVKRASRGNAVSTDNHFFPIR